MDSKRFTEVDGSTGSPAARAQANLAPAPLPAPAYVDPRLEALWAFQSARVATPAPAEAA